MTLTLTYDCGAGVYKKRGQVLTTVTVGETRGSEMLGVINITSLRRFISAFLFIPDISGKRHGAG